MRLALFTNEFPGKVTTFIARDIRALIEAGIEVDVLAIRPYDPTAWRFVPPLLDSERLPRDRVHHAGLLECLRYPPKRGGQLLRFGMDGVRILAASISHGPQVLGKTGYALPKAWTFAQQFGHRYDHVLAYWGNYSATCAYVFHRLVDRPVPFSMFLHAGIDLYLNKSFLRQKMLYSDNVFVVCEYNRAYIQRHFPAEYEVVRDRIHVHHLGLALDAMEYRQDGRAARRLVAVGRLSEEKGYDDLIRAVGLLHRRGVAVDLNLVGEGHLERMLRGLAQSEGVADRVTFRGWLTFDEVQRVMYESTMLVHPSPDEGDAVPTVIKEALALGTPVIGTRVVGIPELLDHGSCGVLVPPKDPGALASAIEELIAHPERAHAMAMRGRQFAERMFDMWKNGGVLANRLQATTRFTTDRRQ